MGEIGDVGEIVVGECGRYIWGAGDEGVSVLEIIVEGAKSTFRDDKERRYLLRVD